MLDDAQIGRILSITAHPDDVDFAAAGTIARWTEAGIEVVYCVVTDGDAGGFDEDFPRDEMPPCAGPSRWPRRSASACMTCASSATGRPGGGHPEPAARPGPGDQAGPAGPRALPQPGAELRQDRDRPPRPPRGGLSGPGRRYPDARNPFAFPELRKSESLAAWTVREVGSPAARPEPLRGRDRDLPAQDRRAARAREPDRAHGGPDRAPQDPAGRGRQAGLPEGRLAEGFRVLDTA